MRSGSACMPPGGICDATTRHKTGLRTGADCRSVGTDRNVAAPRETSPRRALLRVVFAPSRIGCRMMARIGDRVAASCRMCKNPAGRNLFAPARRSPSNDKAPGLTQTCCPSVPTIAACSRSPHGEGQQLATNVGLLSDAKWQCLAPQPVLHPSLRRAAVPPLHAAKRRLLSFGSGAPISCKDQLVDVLDTNDPLCSDPGLDPSSGCASSFAQTFRQRSRRRTSGRPAHVSRDVAERTLAMLAEYWHHQQMGRRGCRGTLVAVHAGCGGNHLVPGRPSGSLRRRRNIRRACSNAYKVSHHPSDTPPMRLNVPAGEPRASAVLLVRHDVCMWQLPT